MQHIIQAFAETATSVGAAICLGRWSWVALSFSISPLLFQVVGTRVLRRMGAARERMPDTYVPEHWRPSVPHVPPPYWPRRLSHHALLCPLKLSAKATSPARKTRCVSGPMSAAVVTDTSELAVTPVRAGYLIYCQQG